MYSSMVVGDDSGSSSDWDPPTSAGAPDEPFVLLVEDLHWKPASLLQRVPDPTYSSALPGWT